VRKSGNAIERAMKNRGTWIVLGVMALASMCVNWAAAAESVTPWEGASDVERKERFIPVELWTIKQIDFNLGNDSHCLEFYWTVSDESESKFHDRHTYSYCPGKSMVHEIQH
jgi:hypothetical protein